MGGKRLGEKTGGEGKVWMGGKWEWTKIASKFI